MNGGRTDLPRGSNVTATLAKIFQSTLFYRKEDVENKTIFVAKLSELSSAKLKKYIVLVCERTAKKRAQYKELQVLSVQTRRLKDNYFSCPPSAWKMEKSGYDVPFVLTERSREKSTYRTQLDSGVELVLFHDSKRKDVSGRVSLVQYPDKMSLLGALESFQCLVIVPQQEKVDDTFVLV